LVGTQRKLASANGGLSGVDDGFVFLFFIWHGFSVLGARHDAAVYVSGGISSLYDSVPEEPGGFC